MIGEALQVIHKRHWTSVYALGGVSLVVLMGLIFAPIPISVTGNAMFLTPGTVVAFQSTATGQVARWRVHVGDVVKKGELLVELDQPLIKKQLDQANQQLKDILERNLTIEAQALNYIDLERNTIEVKKQTLESRITALDAQIRDARSALNSVSRQKQRALGKKEGELAQQKKLAEQRKKEAEARLALAQKLKKEGLKSEDDIVRENRQKLAQDEVAAGVSIESVQAKLDGAHAAEAQLESENRITDQEQQKADLELQLQELIARGAELSEQAQTEDFSREMEANDVRRSIARFEEQLTQQRDVRSDWEGRIIEIAAREGELVSKGVTLGTIDTRTATATLAAVAYFKMKDGKKIEPGMTIRLTPAIVEEARFGGIIGTVTAVSEYPVTTEGLAKTIGNREAAAALTKGDHFVEVHADLVVAETYSGYAWEKFGGPDMKVTAGTIATAKANTKVVHPIAFVIPILEDL